MDKTITLKRQMGKTRARQPSSYLFKLVALIVLLIFQCHEGIAQSSASVQTILESQNIMLEKRAALRIFLSHQNGSVITAYRLRDKSFLLTSLDENAAKALKQEVERMYPEVKITEATKADYEPDGFVKVTNRVTKSEPGFPQYWVTGDNELDELSYRFEKETWTNNQTSTNKN